MTENARRRRNARMMNELAPHVRRRFQQVLLELERLGYRPRAQQAWRSRKEQDRLFRAGRTTLRGGESLHNTMDGGGNKASLALDVVDDDRPLDPSTAFITATNIVAWEVGLETGIEWGLSNAQRLALHDGIEKGAIIATAQLIDLGGHGWDPLHIQERKD